MCVYVAMQREIMNKRMDQMSDCYMSLKVPNLQQVSVVPSWKASFFLFWLASVLGMIWHPQRYAHLAPSGQQMLLFKSIVASFWSNLIP